MIAGEMSASITLASGQAARVATDDTAGRTGDAGPVVTDLVGAARVVAGAAVGAVVDDDAAVVVATALLVGAFVAGAQRFHAFLVGVGEAAYCGAAPGRSLGTAPTAATAVVHLLGVDLSDARPGAAGGRVVRTGIATGAAVIVVAPDIDALAVAAAASGSACVAARPAVAPVTLQIDALVAALCCVLVAAGDDHVAGAFAILTRFADLTTRAARAAVEAAAFRIGALPIATDFPGCAHPATRSAVGLVTIKRPADPITTGRPRGAGSATGPAVILVASEIGTGAIAAGLVG